MLVTRHRALWVVSGHRGWARQQAVNQLRDHRASHSNSAIAWLGEHPPQDVQAIAPARALDWLGSEWGILVFDCFSGFDPDFFGALTGTVKAGGALILLTPPLASWPRYADSYRLQLAAHGRHPDTVSGRFVQRFINLFDGHPLLQIIQQSAADRNTKQLKLPVVTARVEPPAVYQSDDQRAGVAAVLGAARRRRKPTLLFADRGRGKSAALGIAAGYLLQEGKRVWLTGPGRQSVAKVIHHAQTILELQPQDPSKQLHKFTFRPVDTLLTMDPNDCDLLLVDEAAAIPLPLLVALCERYPRCAFATTVHGYEGSGKGFELRFLQAIQPYIRAATCHQMDEPIRWSRGDPLEHFTDQALLLNCEPEQIAAEKLPNVAEQSQWRLIDQDELASNETLLRQVFGLLVHAHYRTRPSDLRQLLDSPTLRCHALSIGQQIVAVLLASCEGGLHPALCRALWLGERRPKGHLLSEVLAIHLGVRDAGTLSAGRIMRIAVHPALRRRGLGRKLVTAVNDDPGLSLDYVGASYAVSDSMLAFWHACDYTTVRVGHKSNAASAALSAVSVRAISAEGAALRLRARHTFKRNLWPQLTDTEWLAYLPESNVALLLAQLADITCAQPELSTEQLDDLVAYAFGRKPLASAIDTVTVYCRWALCCAQRQQTLGRELRSALVNRILQQRTATDLKPQGRKQLDRELRLGIALLLREHSSDTLRKMIDAMLETPAWRRPSALLNQSTPLHGDLDDPQ